MKDILILGGTGKTGRRIARRLRAAGQPVRTASRTGGDVAFDLTDPATWAAALDGVSAAYLLEPNPDGRASTPAFAAEAVAAGVRRLVLMTAHGVGSAGEAHPMWAAEQAVRESGADWTIVRPDWFCQNFSEGFWRQGILDGTLALPTGDGRVPFIDAEDIAEVAASALTDDRHSGQIYELTGPRAISFGAAAGLIGKAAGRTIRHVDVDPELFTRGQVAAGVPLEAARLLTRLLVAIREAGAGRLADGVERALGRPPRSFEDFVAETAWP